MTRNRTAIDPGTEKIPAISFAVAVLPCSCPTGAFTHHASPVVVIDHHEQNTRTAMRVLVSY